MLQFIHIHIIPDKDSPNTSTAKSSRRDSLNDRVMIAQNSSFSEPEPTPPNYHQLPMHHAPTVPMQSPPIHNMMQDMKQDLPVRTNSK
jgi:hypothetical protein